MSGPQVAEEYLTAPEAAVLAGLPYQAFYNAMTCGAFGPPRREGRRWMVPAAGVRAFRDRSAAGAAAASASA